MPRVSCLPASAFTGQAFHRPAAQVTDERLEKAQIEIARAAPERFALSTDALAFDATNLDIHSATTTAGEPARPCQKQAQRSARGGVGGFGKRNRTCAAPTPHLPGDGSDQTLLGECLNALGKLHDAFG